MECEKPSLEQIGWPVDLVEPAKDGPAQHTSSEVAARIAAILGR